jgi:hypothetical protein
MFTTEKARAKMRAALIPSLQRIRMTSKSQNLCAELLAGQAGSGAPLAALTKIRLLKHR